MLSHFSPAIFRWQLPPSEDRRLARDVHHGGFVSPRNAVDIHLVEFEQQDAFVHNPALALRRTEGWLVRARAARANGSFRACCTM